MSELDLGIWRRHRIRMARQTEVAECGLAAITMIANFHGMDVDLASLRRRFQPSLRGAPLQSLISIADKLKLSSRAVKVPLEKLHNLQLPAILHWDMTHYVVIERISRGRVLVHNPEGSSRWMTMAEISEHFTGVALELRPADDFEPAKDRLRLSFSQLWRKVTGLKRALFQTILLSLVLEAFVLASPYYMQVAIDQAIPALDRDLMTVLAIGFGLFTLINAGTALLRSFVLLSAGTSLGYGIATNVARRLFRLPVSWFEKRHTGDILSRFQSVTPIQQFMTQGAIGAIIDGTLAIFVLALMLFYSVQLTAVALIAFLFYALARTISFSAQRSRQEEAIVAAGKEQSTMIESVRGIVTLRLFSREMTRHAFWQSRLTESTNANVSLARIGIWQTTANTFIIGLENIVSVWLAVRLVIDGGFSVGMVFAYMAYKTQFLQRAASLIDQGIMFRMLALHLERLSDIALADTDRSFSGEDIPQRSLSGRIELREVNFRYAPTEPLVIQNVNLVVEPGEHIAITGASGGGKSTLLKILLGLVEPESGEVLVDGVPLAKFGFKNYHEQIGAALQEDSLFAGSLADNIALFDDIPDTARVEASARTAALHDDIMAMPMGYETLVGDMGSSLSGGQKQRLLLARALYRQPKLLVMDEGTSHLDAIREQIVNTAVSALGITRVIVAHRLETILAADRILALDSGGLTDITKSFTHVKELYKQPGKISASNTGQD